MEEMILKEGKLNKSIFETRAGIINVSHALFELDSFQKVFSMAKFLPGRCECMLVPMMIRMEGFSPLFDKVERGQELPTYNLEVSEDDNGKLISVKAVRVEN